MYVRKKSPKKGNARGGTVVSKECGRDILNNGTYTISLLYYDHLIISNHEGKNNKKKKNVYIKS